MKLLKQTDSPSPGAKPRRGVRRASTSTLVLTFVFLVGLGSFLFPIISDAINAQTMTRAVRSYDQKASELSPEERDSLRRAAEAHNESLSTETVPMADPFPVTPDEPAGVSNVDLLTLEGALGHLEVPRITLDLPIYEGTDDSALERGIGHIENSSLPVGGIGTHSVLTGHRGLPTATMFRNLDQMQVGDTFLIHTLGETLAYEVRETVIVLPSEFGRLRIESGRDLVTLVTCDPYMINSHRMLVTGERVPYVAGELADESPVPLSPAQRGWLIQWWPWLLTLLGVTIAAAVVGAIRSGGRGRSPR